MASRLILVRHATLHSDFRGKLNGRANAPLVDNYCAELQQVLPVLRASGAGIIFTSPLPRATACAQVLADSLHMPLETMADLSEVDFGAWDGKSYAEVDASDPENARRFGQWDPKFVFPGGEAIEAFVARVTAATRILADRPEETVVAVSHGGVIRQMVCYLLGLSPRQYLLFDVQCGKAVSLNVFGDRGVLTGLNLGA
jgi:broad specificity phosphatase PhoE